jgi:glycopeptide antibiotics resistance protein
MSLANKPQAQGWILLDTYFFPIEAAVISFPLIAALLTLPYIIFCYHKYGSISLLRTLVLFSFLFYLQCAYFLVVLPLPDPASVVDNTGPFMQLIPFTFVKDFIVDSGLNLQQPSTWLPAFKSATLLQPVFNLLLTVPWGVYLCYYFKKDLRMVVVFTLALSFFFELTQLSGLYGLYSKPYRLFDIDDLLLNTLGGVLGYWFATHFLRFLPSRDRIDEKSRQRSVHVSFSRRLIASLLDAVVIGILQGALSLFFELDNFVSFALALCVYSIGVPLLFRGRTLGKAIVRIRIEAVETNAPLPWLIFVRYLIRNAVILSFSVSSFLLTMDLVFTFQLIVELYPLTMVVLVLIDAGWSLRKEKRLLYERISRTRNASTLEIAVAEEDL